MKRYIKSSIDLIEKIGYIKNGNGKFDVCVVESPYAEMQLATYDPVEGEYDLLDKVNDMSEAYDRANDLFKNQDEYVLDRNVSASRRVTASEDYSFTQGYKYRVTGGPSGDYIGDYDEGLASYYSQPPAKDTLTNDPEEAVFAWFKLESMYPMDASIFTVKDEYARQLCQWVVDHEDTFKRMYNRVDCSYKYEYLFDGAVKYANKSQIIEKYGLAGAIFPFCYG